MGYGWLNIGSVLFGLIAVIIPIINLMSNEKCVNARVAVGTMISTSTCSISLCMQIIYTNYLVNIEDFTAMMDVFEVVSNASVCLTIATVVLNIITIYVKY